ncbi:MAG: InlB B-repeat-containing protein, partial [Clostridiales bacterium]|nr:InlB B-repeat-containing protein [Clostridiales bacterium]
ADPTRTGYNFLGWFLNGSAYNFATPVTGNITLTAQWEEIIIPPATYTVTFVIDGVTVKTQTVEHGAAAQAPAAPAKAGWAFNGWDMSFSNITADLTVTAQWVESKAPGGNQNKFLPLYILAGLAAAAAVWFFAHRSLRSGKKA